MKLTDSIIHSLSHFLPLVSPDYLEKAVGLDSLTWYYSAALASPLKVT